MAMAEQEKPQVNMSQLSDSRFLDSSSPASSTESLLAEFDLEGQKNDADAEAAESGPIAVEYTVAARMKLIYLAGYFMLNLALTIYNKALLQKVLRTVSAHCCPQTG